MSAANGDTLVEEIANLSLDTPMTGLDVSMEWVKGIFEKNSCVIATEEGPFGKKDGNVFYTMHARMFHIGYDEPVKEAAAALAELAQYIAEHAYKKRLHIKPSTSPRAIVFSVTAHLPMSGYKIPDKWDGAMKANLEESDA